MKKKYPLSLFLVGFLMNLVGRFFLLFLASVLLLLVGIWVEVCLHIGILLLLLDVLLSLVEQLMIRKATLDESDDFDFKNATLSPDWRANIMDIVRKKMDSGEKFDSNDYRDNHENRDSQDGDDDSDPHDN